MQVGAVCGLLGGAGCQDRNAGQVRRGDEDVEPPRWRFERLDHLMGEMTLNDVWGRDDGAVFVVGWYGTIFTNRVTRANPAGAWKKMESNTTEHLTAIWGVYNGDQFRQANRRDGEMFAVGWTGTLLHYNPNPTLKQNPVPEDGRWEVVAGPGKGFTPRIKIDPFCPDADGDGFLDDGGGHPVTGGADGWWTLKDTCSGGAIDDCDDNCRLSPNGSLRPLIDRDGDFGDPDPTRAQNCIEWGDDGPSNDLSLRQLDADNNGVGDVCDDALTPTNEAGFLPALFDVWAGVDANDATQLVVVAVGEDGAVVSYRGPNAAQTVTAPALPVSNPLAWIAQEHAAYQYSSDCALSAPGTLPGQACGSTRLPPSCAAQCSSYKPSCNCAEVDPPEPCCVSVAGNPLAVGAPCAGPGCVVSVGGFSADRTGVSADNGCAGVGGLSCSTLCPNCFRSLSKTLRALAVDDGGTIVAVGAGGTLVTLTLAGGNDATGIWIASDFGTAGPPEGMEGRELLTAISHRDGGFHAVGAAGLVAGVNPGAGAMVTGVQCREDDPTTPAIDESIPAVFLTGVFALGDQQGYAIGDRGTLVEFRGGGYCEVIDTDTTENFLGIWVTYVQGVRRLWLVGANGAVVRGGYY